MSDGAQFALLAMMLILPLSALLSRRVPIGSTLKMALAWVAIFAVGAILMAQRERLVPLRDALFGRDQVVTGNTVRIRMTRDGHFWAYATINGITRRMLIDSGATTTALSSKTAAAAGIDTEADTFPRLIDTANGQIAARTAMIERLTLGGIEANGLPVLVSDAFGDTDVLGMNFLSRLASWRVEGSDLILQPKPRE